MGVGSFGIAASVLFGIALFLGPCIAMFVNRSPRTAGATLAVHATVAITGFVLLTAWLSLGQAAR